MPPIIIQDQAPILKTYTVGATPQDTFNWPYRLFAEEELFAYVDGDPTPVTWSLEVGSSLPTEGQPASSGVNIVLDTPISNAFLALVGDMPVQRSVNFPTNGVFPIDTLNEQLNEIFAILQEQETRLDRTLGAARYAVEDYSQLNLPAPLDGYVIAWNGVAGAMQNLDPTAFQGVPGPAGLNWLGTYNALTAYAIDDAVFYNGTSYVCIQAGTGQTPDSSPAYWDVLAQKGADGAGSGDMAAANYDPSGFGTACAFLNGVNPFSKQSYFAMQTLTSGANVAWNLEDEQVAELTLTGSGQLDNPTNKQAGGTYIVIVKQDGVGSHTLSFDTDYKFSDGIAPTITPAANSISVLTFVCDGTNMLGVSQENFS